MSSFVVLRSPFDDDRLRWLSWVRWGLNERAPDLEVTLPERLRLRGLGSCDRRRLLAPMLSRGDGASPTQLPVRTGGGRRFGDLATGGRLSWYRATGSSSKSTAVGPDWARCGSGRTAAAILLCGRAAGSCAASTSPACRVERLATHSWVAARDRASATNRAVVCGFGGPTAVRCRLSAAASCAWVPVAGMPRVMVLAASGP